MGEALLSGDQINTPPSEATPSSGGSGVQPSWRDSLPTDIKDDPSLKNYSDVENLAKAFIHTKAQVGKKGVILPGEKATEEDWNRYYKEIGVPDADKYSVKFPDGYKMPEATGKWFNSAARKYGLMQHQAEGFIKDYIQFEGTQVKSINEAKITEQTKQLSDMKTEWGEAYDKNLNKANFALTNIGGKEFGQKFLGYLKEKGLNNEPMIAMFAAHAANLMKEDTLAEGINGASGESPKEISAQIKEVEGELYSLKPGDPRRPAVMIKFESLHKRLTGGR